MTRIVMMVIDVFVEALISTILIGFMSTFILMLLFEFISLFMITPTFILILPSCDKFHQREKMFAQSFPLTHIFNMYVPHMEGSLTYHLLHYFT